MITLSTADNALKSLYLEVLANQLNQNVSPLWNTIERTSENVTGKKIVKLVSWGLNGGVGAGLEDGSLPTSAENKYLNFELPLINLYGALDISDKAVRASKHSSGAFLNLLNAEMESLLGASKFNLARMLYGDGTGLLAVSKSKVTYLGNNVFEVDTLNNLTEGMILDFYTNDTRLVSMSGARIAKLDHADKLVFVDRPLASDMVANGTKLYIQGSKDKEIAGLKYISGSTMPELYGLVRAANAGLKGYAYAKGTTEAFDDILLTRASDEVNERCGAAVDYIACAFNVRRAYQKYLKTTARNTDVLNLQGGFKAISFNGMPVVADRFVADGEMFMLDTSDYKLHQLCDWEWLAGDNGKILKQRQGFATYTATLVKYANLLCSRPGGIAHLSKLC